MSQEKAKEYFLGQNGQTKLNCAQSVVKACAGGLGVSEEEISLYAGCGGGKAPEGVCGAYYAAYSLLSKKRPQQISLLKETFSAAAGSLTCKEIRAHKKLTCLGCVEKAADFLQRS